jgi:hypothetical protein
MSLLYHLEKSIQINGQVMFTDMTMLESVMTAVITVLQDKASCQTCDEEEVAEDEFEDAAEHDQLLIEYACDILPTTCIAIGGKKIRGRLERILPSPQETSHEQTSRNHQSRRPRSHG